MLAGECGPPTISARARNFFELYAPMVDNWLIFDGSRGDPELVVFSVAGLKLVFDRDLFALIKGEVQES
jgi:hypothetical protein